MSSTDTTLVTGQRHVIKIAASPGSDFVQQEGAPKPVQGESKAWWENKTTGDPRR